MQFSNLSLSPVLLRALEQEGYTTPTPIQAQAIPHIIAGRDVLGCAQTGTGKTAAFTLPLLQRLMTSPVDKSARGPMRARALILSPTRELASQIADSVANYGRDSGLAHTTIYGGVSQFHQERALRRGVDIIVATPGRLQDLMEQRLVDLSCIEVLVLDEADRMLDMGFIKPIREIAAKTPAARQTLMFSATMPGEIMKLAASLLREPIRVSVAHAKTDAPKIEQSLYMVHRQQKQVLLEKLLSEEGTTRVVVFTKTKHGAERVGKKLLRTGVEAETIHGNKSQGQRNRALDSFRKGKARVLVATDVAARGLDVDDITHVINFDLPMEPEAYVHRIGRTARAGASGIAISFCDGEERSLLRDVERLLGGKIPVAVLPDLPKGEIDHSDRDRPERGDRYTSPRHQPSQMSQRHPEHGGSNAGPQGGGRPADRKRPAAKPARRSHGFEKPLDAPATDSRPSRPAGMGNWNRPTKRGPR